MRESKVLGELREARHRLREEELRVGREEFIRRERKRVEEFLQGTLAELVPSRSAKGDGA